MSDYKYAGNGTYQKVSDGSSPYGKDENGEFYLMGKSSGGGGSVDVLGTVIDSFKVNAEALADGDTLQVALDKLNTFDKNINTELNDVKSSIASLPAPFTEAKVRSTVLTGVVFTNSTAVIATDALIVAIGKLQSQITADKATISENTSTISAQQTIIADLTARIEALEGA